VNNSNHHHQHAEKASSYKFIHKPLIVYELKLLSALNFQTTVPLRYILPHMEAIMSILDTNMLDYLGEEAYNEFMANQRRMLMHPVPRIGDGTGAMRRNGQQIRHHKQRFP
jgi:hypothetical protein